MDKFPSRSRPAHRAHAKPARPKKGLARATVMAMPKLALNAPPRGRFFLGSTSFPCAIGARRVTRHKSEGDRASPVGEFRLIGGFYRPVATRPFAPWPLRAIREADGWCDDPRAPVYNRPVPLPSLYSCEKLWRNDGLYDLVLVLDYNVWPRKRGKGSAIFLHCARADLAPTEGCIALRAADLRKVLARLARDAVVAVR
ncbi:MAG TPA: L,D-transpeptidase family protein [Methylovirgula sp.]|jgi:L,D-peptidoglycan transpeptidase YkuD (ErfK/YbiS/YcfS/YnhG family)